LIGITHQYKCKPNFIPVNNFFYKKEYILNRRIFYIQNSRLWWSKYVIIDNIYFSFTPIEFLLKVKFKNYILLQLSLFLHFAFSFTQFCQKHFLNYRGIWHLKCCGETLSVVFDEKQLENPVSVQIEIRFSFLQTRIQRKQLNVISGYKKITRYCYYSAKLVNCVIIEDFCCVFQNDSTFKIEYRRLSLYSIDRDLKNWLAYNKFAYNETNSNGKLEDTFLWNAIILIANMWNSR